MFIIEVDQIPMIRGTMVTKESRPVLDTNSSKNKNARPMTKR